MKAITAVQIKVSSNGKYCDNRCPFLGYGLGGDYCKAFDKKLRIYNYSRSVNYVVRLKQCIKGEIK